MHYTDLTGKLHTKTVELDDNVSVDERVRLHQEWIRSLPAYEEDIIRHESKWKRIRAQVKAALKRL